jgi:hypothetical protein
MRFTAHIAPSGIVATPAFGELLRWEDVCYRTALVRAWWMMLRGRA